MRAIHHWFDEIEKKDAMQETFIRFATYLIVPAPQAGVAYTSFAQRGSVGGSK